MIAVGETIAAAAELPFFLPQSSNPLQGLANHAFVLGEVQVKLPGGAFFNIPVNQIVEKVDNVNVGRGAYAVQLTPAQCLAAGVAYVKANVTGAQPYTGTESIGLTGGDLIVGVGGGVPFYLPQSADPVNGAPVTGHPFVLGEVLICYPQSNTYVNAALVDISEVGLGAYEVNVSVANSVNRGKAYLYVNVSGAQPFQGTATILNAQSGGLGSSGKPVITIVTSLPPAPATTPIVITVVGSAGAPIRRAWLDVVFPGILASEVIHNGDKFGLFYTNNTNSRVTYTDGLGRVGYQYTILRDGGWPTGSFPTTTSFEISAVDTIGNGT